MKFAIKYQRPSGRTCIQIRPSKEAIIERAKQLCEEHTPATIYQETNIIGKVYQDGDDWKWVVLPDENKINSLKNKFTQHATRN